MPTVDQLQQSIIDMEQMLAQLMQYVQDLLQNQSSSSQAPCDQAGSDQSSACQPSCDQTGSDQPPGSQAPSDQTGSDQTAGNQAPTDQTASDQTAGNQAPSDQTASDQSTGNQTPASAAQGKLGDALAQNDYNQRGIVTADIPFHGPGSWGDGKWGIENNTVPDGVVAYAPWGVVAQEQGQVADPNATVSIANQHVYFHQKGGGWVDAANPGNTGFWEASYYNDFHGDLSVGNNPKTMDDGSYQFVAPAQGMVDHFGNGNTPVTFDPNKYDGIYETLDIKADRANSGLVADLGGDYERASGLTQNTAGQNDANLRNPGAGADNWTRLSDQWQTKYFTTMDQQAFLNDLPPGLS